MKSHSSSDVVTLRGKRWSTAIGANLPLRLSIPLGVNSQRQLESEVAKLKTILNPTERLPDVLVDLSTCPTQPRLYEEILANFGGPVGLLPHYLATNNGMIDDNLFLEEVERAIQCGISHITLHLTASRDLLEKAKKSRILPTTSRGGGIVLADVENRKISENVFERQWDSLLKILAGTGVAVSLGSTFRPGACFEALDEIHIEEIELQTKFAMMLIEAGIPVMREGIGHADILSLKRYASIIEAQPIQLPLMALGPPTVDHAGSLDPIAAAMGIAVLGESPSFAIVQAISAQEHLGGIPNLEVVVDSMRIARVATDAVNSARGYRSRSDLIGFHRQANQSCVTPKHVSGIVVRRATPTGCGRCASMCPLDDRPTADGALEILLRSVLPSEIVERTIAFIHDIESLKLGSLILFGSTAKRRFCFARIGSKLMLQSDLEFNIIGRDQPSDEECGKLSMIIASYQDYIGDEQPLFDVDVRCRTIESLSSVPYYSLLRRELFCYGVTNGRDADECISSETDPIDGPSLLPQYLLSSLEWLALRFAHLSNLPSEQAHLWRQAIFASFTCKLAPIHCHILGVPCTLTPKDVLALKTLDLEPKFTDFVDALQVSWHARMQKSGDWMRSNLFDGKKIMRLAKSAIYHIEQLYGSEQKGEPNLTEAKALLFLMESALLGDSIGDLKSRMVPKFRDIWIRRRGRDPMFQAKYERHLGGLFE